jgi:indole-3-glycerol phosphate synthase
VTEETPLPADISVSDTYLSEILAAHRARARADRRAVDALVAEALTCPDPRPFARALRRDASKRGLAVIAEIKRRSPSKGAIDLDLDPAATGREYAAGGATCLSVLTDERFFGGSVGDLHAARLAVDLPVLRKDFTVSPADICDARLMGADAVLLIMAALSDDEVASFLSLCRRLSIDALVEIHDRSELDRALALGASLVGVNQRDLRTFAVDGDRAVRLAAGIPADVVAVAESGIGGPDDARRLADAGYDAVLVGESLVRAVDRAAAVARLVGHPCAARVPAATGIRQD